MNERIRPLYYECQDESQSTEQCYQKFAELIVRECIAICKDTDGEDNIDARSGRQDCAVEIREHFGVETVDDTLRPRSTYYGNDV